MPWVRVHAPPATGGAQWEHTKAARAAPASGNRIALQPLT